MNELQVFLYELVELLKPLPRLDRGFAEEQGGRRRGLSYGHSKHFERVIAYAKLVLRKTDCSNIPTYIILSMCCERPRTISSNRASRICSLGCGSADTSFILVSNGGRRTMSAPQSLMIFWRTVADRSVAPFWSFGDAVIYAPVSMLCFLRVRAASVKTGKSLPLAVGNDR